MKTKSSAFARGLRKSTVRKQTAFACASLFIAFSLVVLPLFNFFTVRAAGTMSGFVFQDFNANGFYDTTTTTVADPNIPLGTVGVAVDQPVGGVTVTVYAANGASKTTTTNATTGVWSIDTAAVPALPAGPYRVEFTNLPAGFKPSRRNADSLNGGAVTTESGSTVQFVPDATTANVNLAINVPEDYCQNNPEVASCNYSFGNQTTTSAAETALLSFPYSAGSNASGAGVVVGEYDKPDYTLTTNALINVTATQTGTSLNRSVGTTFGLAYARSTKTLYASAFFKRHSGFGRGADNTLNNADDAGAIYVVNRTTAAPKGEVLNTFTVPNATTNSHNTADYQTDNNNAGWDAVGKTSLGGMAISEDDSRLFVMNLENRRLYALNPATGSVLASQAVPTSGLATDNGNCDPADARPFAVSYYRGEVYVGMVCSGESSANADTVVDGNYNQPAEDYRDSNNNKAYDAGEPFYDQDGDGSRDAGEAFTDGDGNGIFNLGDTRKLQAYVFKVNPITLQFAATPALRVPLGYERGINQKALGADAMWRPWSNVYRSMNVTNLDRTVYSQPMLTGITFDRGNMVLGLRDRAGDQVGHRTQSKPGDTTLMQPRPGGDTLRACGNPTSGWTLESNRVCGGNTPPVATQNTSQGPGNGEFYQGDAFTLTGNYNTGGAVVGKGSNHDELSLGGVAQLPGAPDAMMTMFDPIATDDVNETHDGGVRWLSNTTGNFTKGYRIYAGVTGADGTLGKANGIGDLEMLCDSAPIEVGNRVWIDTDGDGVQDPINGTNEAGRQNVLVNLLTGDLNGDGDTADTGERVVVGSFTTLADGEWYFNETNVADGDRLTPNNQPGLKINTNYIAQISASDFTGGAGTGDLAGLKLTRSNVVALMTGETAVSNNHDSRDSDAQVFSGLAEISFNSSTAGSNNHTLDFGFTTTIANSVSIGSHVFLDRDNGGAYEPSGADGDPLTLADNDTGIDGVTVELYYDADGVGGITGAENTVPYATYTTVNGGIYIFDNLTSGRTCIIRIPVSNFTGALSNAQTSSAVDDNADNRQDGDDNGAQTAGSGTVVSSPTITLTADAESTAATAAPQAENSAGSTQDDAPMDDNNGDMSVDFGFVPTLYSLGNRVWYDTNNNGQIDGTEVGVNGVSVTLLNADNTVYDSNPNTAGLQDLTQTTISNGAGSNGYYRFDNLPAGNYRVRINPIAANFGTTGILRGAANTTGVNFGDVDTTAATQSENGSETASFDGSSFASLQTFGILSNVITLGTGASEPTNETDFGTGDNVAPRVNGRTDLTVDMGFYRVAVGGFVWNDNNDNGIYNSATEAFRGDAQVRIFQGATEILVGPDGILGTADDAAGGVLTPRGGNRGRYNFSGLLPGDYTICVTTPSGTRSSTDPTPQGLPDPDTNVIGDDNGAPGACGGATNIVSLPVTLAAGNAGKANNTLTNATGTTNDPTVDFGVYTIPTAVGLKTFDATAYSDGVLLSWRTGFEVNNLGFKVWRERGGKREQINREIIAGSALLTGEGIETRAGFEYQWFDPQGTADAVYYLEDVDLNGTETHQSAAKMQYATTENAPPARQAKTLTELQQNGDGVQIERVGLSKPKAQNPKSEVRNAGQSGAKVERASVNPFAGGAAIKISVRADGWHRVERSALAAAGLPAVDNSTLQLFLNNKEKAMRVNVDGSLEFYGKGVDKTETDASVHWLVWGAGVGKRINTVDARGAGDGVNQTFSATVERRDRLFYIPAIINGDRENFYGGIFTSAGTSKTLNLSAVETDGTAVVEADLQGFSRTPHQVEIKVNGVHAGYGEFNEYERGLLSFPIGAGVLREGANQVSFAETQGGARVTLIENVRLRYYKRYRAANGTLRFTVPASGSTTVDGFASGAIRVLDITDANNVTELQVDTAATPGGFAARIPATGQERVLLALEATAAINAPADVRANAPSNWRGFAAGADFIILSHRNFEAAAKRLAEARREQGLNAIVVNVEDIYDEYGGGAHSNAAVREFLAQAASAWKIRPQYLLLFGDASPDPRNYQNLGNNDFIPTRFVETAVMESASDDLLADFDGDNIADIATGRFPVRTAQQADAIVDKMLRFEAPKQFGRQAREVMLVGDAGFEESSDGILEILKSQTPINKINRTDGTTAEVRGRILDGINRGARIVNYVGHGSKGSWADNDLLKNADAATLTNAANLSLFVNLSCYTGSFAEVSADSLSEALLLAPNGGAYAVWASSGVTPESDQAPMSTVFYTNLTNNTGARLGDALRQAKQNTDSADVRRTWNLLGDPTMRLR